MGFPIVSPVVLKEIKERLGAETPDEFCDVIVSPAAVEYAPRLNNPEVVKKLMEEKDVLAYSMINLTDDQSEQFVTKSRELIEAYPTARYYWQMRTLFMSALQNRSVNLEKRLLLLNYAVKTIQGMIDKGQPNLIPQFIEEFSELQSYERVLEYFKDVRPNPGYSLADGISLHKSLNKPNAAYKDVMNTIYRTIGVSGPETLKMADMKKYIGLRKSFTELAAGEKSHYIENIVISYVWTYAIPFSDPHFNFWDHFVFFCSLYNAFKVMITCYAPDGNDEAFLKAVCAFDEALRSSGGKLIRNIVHAVNNAGQNNNGDLAVLTLS